MTTIPTSLAAAALCLLAARSPIAQDLPLPKQAFRVPIHRAAPVGRGPAGDPGVWAAGADYKASFHDGFAYYPRLGAGYRDNLPLRWRTRSVAVHGNELIGPLAGAEQRTPWRYEYSLGSVTEAYDVREAGVEQTFTIHHRPPQAGDLVVRGEIETTLKAPVVEAAHRKLVFRDAAGNAVLEYGAATAIDARGARREVTTACDGRLVTLTVDGDWLAGALFPVVIDPLTATVLVDAFPSVSGSGVVAAMDVAVQTESTGHNVLVVCSRIWSQTDRDVYAFVCNHDYSGAAMVFAEVSSQYDAPAVAAAFVGGADRWVIAAEQRFATATGTFARILLCFLDRDDTTGQSLFQVPIEPLFPQAFRNPDLGGIQSGGSGTRALLVYQLDDTNSLQNTNHTEIVAAPIEAATRTALSAHLAAGTPVGTTWDRENPRVNQTAFGDSDGWMVVWQQLNRTLPLSSWSIAGARASGQGAFVSAGLIAGGSLGQQRLVPQVAGAGYEYLVSWTLAGTSAIEAARTTWALTGGPAIGPVRTVASAASGHTLDNGGLAFDLTTFSHWCATWTDSWSEGGVARTRPRAARLGGTGGVTETVPLFVSLAGNGFAPAVAHDETRDQFDVVFATDEILGSERDPIYGRHLVYPSAAVTVPYGTGCGTGIAASPRRPYAGHARYEVDLVNVNPASPALCLISLAPAAIPLDAAGLPGCMLNVDMGPLFVTAVAGVTLVGGWFPVALPLPDAPVATGDLFLQFFYYMPFANPVGFQGTQGLRVQVR